MGMITISTENRETYSSISNIFIDYFMTEANGEFVKVYLYLVRLLNNNSSVSVADIADHFNLTEKDICRAIKYWVTRGVLKLNYDGKGQPTGIVLMPLSMPKLQFEPENDVMSMLGQSAMEAELATTTSKRPASNHHQMQNRPVSIEENVISTAPAKPRITSKDIEDRMNDENWRDLVYQVETVFGKVVSAADTKILMYIYDTLKFNIDLVDYLIEYCATLGKKSCRYMEAVAISWYKDGIKTKQQAKEQSAITNGIAKLVYSSLGIRRDVPTSIEMAYINTWYKDLGFPVEMIKLACDKAIETRPNSATFAYVNGIMESWAKNNAKSVEDVERLDKEYAAKKSIQKMMKDGNQEKVSSFNNFKQTRMDDKLDEMEQLFIREVNMGNAQ